MKALKYCAAAWLIATVAFTQELNWTELARRPDLWPAQCTAKQSMKFEGGVTINAGQKLTVLKVNAGNVQVSTLDERTTFEAEPDETDVLLVAQQAFAKLTPKQRALSYESLVRQKEFWPYRVTLNKSFDLGGGKAVRAGEQLVLMDVQPGKLLLKSDALRITMNVVPQATDFLVQARRLAEDAAAVPRFATEMKRQEDEDKAAAEKDRMAIERNRLSDDQKKAADEKRKALGVVVNELDGKLLNSVTGQPQPLDRDALPRYIVFYRGSSTCPITREFTPTLIKYYQQMKPRHPEFEIVYMMTESADETSKFAKQIGFSWRAIEYESTGSMPTVRQPIQGLLPQLIVMDRSGRVLANGWQNSASNALRQLDALLKTTAQPPR